MTPLEIRYRRILAWYPRDYRLEYEDEMVGVLLATSGPDRRRPTLEISEPTLLLETTVRAWVAGVEGTAIDWLRTREPARAEVELVLGTQLGVMLFNTASYDPAVAERVEWWMRREPADGLWAFHLRSMARVFNAGLIANMARLLSDTGPGSGP